MMDNPWLERESLLPKKTKEPKESRELRLNTLRDWYLTTIASTDARFAKLKTISHAEDPTIQAAWEAERNRMRGVATTRILDSIGKEETDLLREAVAPEDLVDVLQRAGAGYDTLMMIGKGKEELRALIAQRQDDLSRMTDALQKISGPKRLILGHLEKKLRELDRQLAAIENKDPWERPDAQRHRSLQTEFSATVQNFFETIQK